MNRRPQRRFAALGMEAAGTLLGSSFNSTLREMTRAQWLSPAQLRVRADNRLAALLRHAATHVPFYAERYRRLALAPDDLRTVSDLAALPILTKSDYREKGTDPFCAANAPGYRRLERTTSGSSGEPFSFFLDREAVPVVFASHLFYDSWHGLRPFDKRVRIAAPRVPVAPLPADVPLSVRLRGLFTARLQNVYESWVEEKFPLWEADATRARHFWLRMKAVRPQYVMGYTSTLATIAEDLLQLGLPLSRPLKAVVAIAETLSPERRRVIDRYFGAPIVNRYGLREFGSWSAQSCRESPDRFHLNTELVVCEIVREDGSPCVPGETGRVVMTDLYNYARPFIRYDTGDRAAAASDGCACGRGFPLIGPIDGRSMECLRTPSGKVISPAILGHYLFLYNDHLEFVRQYQLVYDSRGQVRLLIVPDVGWSEQRREKLRADLGRLIGEDVQISVEPVPRIAAEASGKRPIIKIIR